MASPSIPRIDFNGDGYGDLAIGAPAEDIGTATGAGAVNVLYGSASGLVAAGNQLWTQDDLQGSTESADNFGRVLATGDFDGDGYGDLAIGVPYEDLGTATNAGAVNVLYASASGLVPAGNQFWTQDDLQGSPATYDNFGWSLP